MLSVTKTSAPLISGTVVLRDILNLVLYFVHETSDTNSEGKNKGKKKKRNVNVCQRFGLLRGQGKFCIGYDALHAAFIGRCRDRQSRRFEQLRFATVSPPYRLEGEAHS